MSRVKTVVYAFVPLFVLAVMGETAARIHERFHPVIPVDRDLGFAAMCPLFVPRPDDPAVMVTAAMKRMSFHVQDFRMRKPRGVFRLAVIGGSSVFQLDPDLRALAKRLGAEGVAIEVINAGGLSYGSQRLLLVACEIARYDLDLAILYLGHNEFEEERQSRLLPRFEFLTGLAKLADHSALFRAAREVSLRAWVRRRVAAQIRVRDIRSRGPLTDAEVRARMRAFDINVTAMVEALQRARVPVLMASIPSNMLPFERGREFERRCAADYAAAYAARRKDLAASNDRSQASSLENDILERIARRHAIPFVDFLRTVEAAEPHGIPGETLFVDHCHLNAAGRVLWIKTFEPWIRAEIRRRMLRGKRGS